MGGSAVKGSSLGDKCPRVLPSNRLVGVVILTANSLVIRTLRLLFMSLFIAAAIQLLTVLTAKPAYGILGPCLLQSKKHPSMTDRPSSESKSSLSGRGTELVGFIATFFPMIAAILIFSFDRFWEDWLSRHAAPILAGVLFVMLLEFSRGEKSRQKYVTLLNDATEKISRVLSEHKNLKTAVDSAFEILPNPKTLRIYSISSAALHPLLTACDTPIENVKLLLANPKNYLGDTGFKDFEDESKIAICWGWTGSVIDEKIKHLELNQYNFYPTEWFAVLDSEVVIFGHYKYDKDNIAQAKRAGNCFVLRNRGVGSDLVDGYIAKFDALFAQSAIAFGEATHSGQIGSLDKSLKRGHWPDKPTAGLRIDEVHP